MDFLRFCIGKLAVANTLCANPAFDMDYLEICIPHGGDGPPGSGGGVIIPHPEKRKKDSGFGEKKMPRM